MGSHLALRPDSTLRSGVILAGEGSQLVYPEVASIGKNWPQLGLESLPSRTIPVAPDILTLLEAKLGPENKDSFAQPWILGLFGGSKGQMEAPEPLLHFPAKGSRFQDDEKVLGFSQSLPVSEPPFLISKAGPSRATLALSWPTVGQASLPLLLGTGGN